MWQLYSPPEHRPSFYLKMETFDVNANKTYRLFVTNYVKLWSQHYSKRNFLQIMSNCNPDLEFTNEESFLLTGLNLLNDPHDINKIKFTEACDELNVNLMKISGFVLKLNFNLPVCSPQHFFDVVTRPLLLTIDDLRQSESELRTLLKKKDQEITLFAQECGENFSMMKCFSTPKYLDEVHMKKHNVYEEMIGSHDGCAPKAVLSCHPSPQPNNVIMKEEPLETPAVSSTSIEVKAEHVDGVVTSLNAIIDASTKRQLINSGTETVPKTEPNTAPKLELTDSTCDQTSKLDHSNKSSTNVSHTHVSETKSPETESVSVDRISNNCAPDATDESHSRLDVVHSQPTNEIGQWAKKSNAKRKKLNY